MIGLSPLHTTHPGAFQRPTVRTSTLCYERFILVMCSSSRFGSTACDLCITLTRDASPYSDSLSLRLRPFRLNLATYGNSLAHYAKGTLSGLILTDQRPLTGCRLTVSDTISLPSSGYFSPFPHGTCSLSVTNSSLALDDGPPEFIQDFSCPVLLEKQLTDTLISLTRLSLSMVGLPKPFNYKCVFLLRG